MKSKLVHNLSANVLQLVVNQMFGVLIFYLLSVNLDKNSFGQINFALALLLAVFNILSFGIDQVVVKKVAQGDNAQSVLSLYTFHVIIAGFSFYGILLIGNLFFARDNELYRLILLIGAGKLMIFFSTPLKQISSGMERFKLLSYMLVVSNAVRGICLVVLALLHHINLQTIVWVFIAGDALELIVCAYLFKRHIKVPIKPRWAKIEYRELLKQSLPQVGVVLITSALARFDWLFIGFILSAAKLAEYSFAYKIFEISTLPLLAIAPLLIPRFTKLFKSDDYREADLKLLIRIELVIAAFTALLVNMCWNPIIDMVTGGKYGAVNTTTVFILSLCIPFIYLSNFLWTIFFVQNRLKMILHSFLITFGVNVAGDLLLIPIYKNEGAAAAFLLACLAQVVFYLTKNTLSGLRSVFYSLILSLICAAASGFLAKMLFQNVWLSLFSSMLFFVLSLLAARQIKPHDGEQLIKLLNW